MRWALFVIAGLYVLSTLVTVAKVGKPRKPTTGADAAVVVVLNAAITVALVLAGIRL